MCLRRQSTRNEDDFHPQQLDDASTSCSGRRNMYSKFHKLLVQMEPLQAETPTMILTTMCPTVKIGRQVLFLWVFLLATSLFFLAFLKPDFFKTFNQACQLTINTVCVCVHVLWKCNKTLDTNEREEDSRVNNSYLHNENIVIKRFRGVAPMLVSWCHVKYHVKQPNALECETCQRYAIHNLHVWHFLSNCFLKWPWFQILSIAITFSGAVD